MQTGKSSKRPGYRLPSDYSKYELTKKDFVKQLFLGAAMSALISYTFYKSFLIFIILLVTDLAIYPKILKKKLAKKRQEELLMQFREIIGSLSGYISSGYSAENAFYESYLDAKKNYGNDALITKEFQNICMGVRLNKPIETLLNDFAARSALPDIRHFAEVFVIARRCGGDMRSIIDSTVYTLREKITVSQEIETLTSSKRLEQKIMNILPFAMVFYINMTNSDVLSVMYESIIGRAIMTICLIMLVFAGILQEKILDIEV